VPAARIRTCTSDPVSASLPGKLTALFPRVLPDQGFDLFTAVESYQNNLIRQGIVDSDFLIQQFQ